MANQELLDYIQSNIANGSTHDSISKELLNAGWNTEDIENAFRELENPNPEPSNRPTNTGSALASLPRRAFAFLIDLILLVIGLAIFGLSGANVSGSWNWTGATGLQTDITILEPFAGLALLIAIVIYFTLLESGIGSSIGKQILGLRVVNMDKEKASFFQVALKSILKPLDMILVGFGLALLSPKNQTLGDRVAHTVVVKKSNIDNPFPTQPTSMAKKIFGGIFVFMAVLFTILFIVSIPHVKELNKTSRAVATEINNLYPDDTDTMYSATFSDEFRSQVTLDEFRKSMQSKAFVTLMNKFAPENVTYYSWSYNKKQAVVRGIDDDIIVTLGYQKDDNGEWELLLFHLNSVR